MTEVTLYNAAEKAMSKKLPALVVITVLTGFVSTAKAGESPSILNSLSGPQQHILSDEEMSKVVGTFTYKVKPGDTLFSLGRFFGMTWQHLYNLNRNVIGSNPNRLSPGQVIYIPGPGPGVTNGR